MSEPMLTIHNHHPAACGIPPAFSTEAADLYIGYFENRHGELYEREGNLLLAVEDDGVGFNPNETAEGAGITGMRERAALVNGSIRLDSEPGMGTHVVVEIPV